MGNVGLGQKGFANVSLEYGNADPTNGAIQRNDAAGLRAAGLATTACGSVRLLTNWTSGLS